MPGKNACESGTGWDRGAGSPRTPRNSAKLERIRALVRL